MSMEEACTLVKSQVETHTKPGEHTVYGDANMLACLAKPTNCMAIETNWAPFRQGLMDRASLDQIHPGARLGSSPMMPCLATYVDAGSSLLSFTGGLLGAEITEALSVPINCVTYDVQAAYAIEVGDRKRGKGIDSPDPKLPAKVEMRTALSDFIRRKMVYDKRRRIIICHSSDCRDSFCEFLSNEIAKGMAHAI